MLAWPTTWPALAESTYDSNQRSPVLWLQLRIRSGVRMFILQPRLIFLPNLSLNLELEMGNLGNADALRRLALKAERASDTLGDPREGPGAGEDPVRAARY